MSCPYSEIEEPEDWDREDQNPPARPPASEPRMPVAKPIDPVIPLSRGLKQLKEAQPQPTRSPIPFPRRRPGRRKRQPIEVPQKAAFERGNTWPQKFARNLNTEYVRATSPVRVPARRLSPGPSPKRAAYIRTPAVTAAASERALTRSLGKSLRSASPWDTGARTPPQSALNKSPAVRSQTSRRKGMSLAGKIGVAAAATLTGAGAAYLTSKSGGRGGSGGYTGKSAAAQLIGPEVGFAN